MIVDFFCLIPLFLLSFCHFLEDSLLCRLLIPGMVTCNTVPYRHKRKRYYTDPG